MLAELVETAAPNESDGSFRQFQTAGRFRIGHGRLLEEEHPNQRPATVRQTVHRYAEEMSPLSLLLQDQWIGSQILQCIRIFEYSIVFLYMQTFSVIIKLLKPFSQFMNIASF